MSKVLYFLIKGNEALICTFAEMRNLCSLQGYTSPVLISRQVMDNGLVRPATPDELKHMPTDEPAVKLAVVTDEGEILLRFDQPPLKLDQARLNWPNARHGEKTDRGYPLYVPEQELFQQLAQR
jgi:hypothetical protein